MEENQISGRSSRQREAVKNNILNRFDHPTAEMVYLAVRETEPRISLATVYRNLDRLVDDGLAEKFMVPDGPDHYDPISHEHYHVKCRDCNEIFDINISLEDYISRQVNTQSGIKIHSLQVVAEGVCSKCKC